MVLFCLCFCFIIRFFAPENASEKFSRCQVLCFWVFSLLFWFFCRRRRFFVFFFKRDRSGSHRAHPHTHFVFFFCPFLVCVPAAFCCSPVLAVRPFFLAFCRGAILGPGRFLDSLGTSLRPFFSDARRQGCFLVVSFVLFSPSVVFCGSFHTN